jgi:hypothetical protein
VVSCLLAGPAWANDDAADSTNAAELWNRGLTGAGVTVGIWEASDGGDWEVRTTHEAFTYGMPSGQSRVSFGETTNGGFASHATHVAGTIGGAHIPGRERSWGMAPGVTMLSFSSGGDTSEVLANPQIDISNHSYGSRQTMWFERDYEVPDGNGGTVTRRYDSFFPFSSLYTRDRYDEDPRYGVYSFTARAWDRTLNQRPTLLAFRSAGNERGQNDRYSDLQNDRRYVARFSQSHIDTVGVIGTDLGNGLYLVHADDYAIPADDGPGGGGYDTLAGATMSKNAVIVGAVNDHLHDPHIGGSIQVTGFTSYGPTDSGSLGIDLMGNGEKLYSAADGSDTAYTNKNGTSMSSPNAAGTAALILEHWRSTTHRTPVSATQKGLLMHTASDSTRDRQVGPDYRTGYGLLNGLAAVQHIDAAHSGSLVDRTDHVIEDTLDEGDHHQLLLTAVGGAIKVSLGWLDPALEDYTLTDDFDNRASDLVHDLDLWLTDADGTIYFPWTLDPENPKNAAVRNQHNRVDNFTQVLIDNAAAGTELTLHVGHFGNLQEGSQDYALFISGATIPEPATAGLFAIGLGSLTLGRRRRADRTWRA